MGLWVMNKCSFDFLPLTDQICHQDTKVKHATQVIETLIRHQNNKNHSPLSVNEEMFAHDYDFTICSAT